VLRYAEGAGEAGRQQMSIMKIQIWVRAVVVIRIRAVAVIWNRKLPITTKILLVTPYP
jgi:hypothetical protein